MTMASEYHYLIAGLPELAMADKKLPVGVVELRERLLNELHPDDRPLVKLCFLQYDIPNITNTVYTEKKPFDHRGIYSPFEIEAMADKKLLEEGISHSDFPFIDKLLADALTTDSAIGKEEFAAKLISGYIQTLENHTNPFISQYGSFERNLRNVFAALNGRKFQLPYEKQLVGGGEGVEALAKSHARVFGLSFDIPQIEAWVHLFENNNLLEREWKLDLLRWQFIDDTVLFNYFTIERVLAFLLKLMIVDRWLSLDEQKGGEQFRQLVLGLEKSVAFADEYKLNHGKSKQNNR